jgi:hypothetical protein
MEMHREAGKQEAKKLKAQSKKLKEKRLEGLEAGRQEG